MQRQGIAAERRHDDLLSTGALSPAFISDTLIYTSSNCSGPAYYAVGGNGNRPPPMGAAIALGGTGALHVLRGPEKTVVPASYKSPSASGTCTAGEPYDVYGPYVLASDAPSVAMPAITWTAPLSIELQ